MPGNSFKTSRRSPVQSRAIWLVIVLLVVAYAVFRPSLERQLGVSLSTVPVGTDSESVDGAAHRPDAEDSRSEARRVPRKSACHGDPPSDRLGRLTDIGGGVKRSTAGLCYTPGSEERHRLKHVLRHDNDQPDRPGKHGVFDGDAETLLAVIDEAYLLIKQGSPRVKTQRQGDRLVHEVDMQRRIGFVGGQVGQRGRHPSATHVRLILEGDRVISAFPF